MLLVPLFPMTLTLLTLIRTLILVVSLVIEFTKVLFRTQLH